MKERRNLALAVITRIVVSLIILAVAIVIFMGLWMTRPDPQRRAETRDLRRVVVMQSRPVEIRRQFEGYGTADAMYSSDVPARVTAIVIQRPEAIQPGLAVKKGQMIARLDPSDFERQVDIATNNIADLDAQLERVEIERSSWEQRVELARDEVTLAQEEFDRASEAYQRQAAKKRELDLAEIALLKTKRNLVDAQEALSKIPADRRQLEALRQAQDASLKIARMNLERCVIVSPIDGVLQTVDVEVGENVAPGQRVARVVNLSKVEVPIQIAASARPYLAVGDEVLLESAGNSRQTWVATVTRIAPEDEESSRSVIAYVELNQDPASSGILPPGKFIRARISSSTIEPRWVVPRRAMRNDRIKLIEDGLIASRRIKVDFQIQKTIPELGLPDDLWLVLDEQTPLAPGAYVVVTPSRTMMEGLPVEPVLATGSPPAAMSIREPSK